MSEVPLCQQLSLEGTRQSERERVCLCVCERESERGREGGGGGRERGAAEVGTLGRLEEVDGVKVGVTALQQLAQDHILGAPGTIRAVEHQGFVPSKFGGLRDQVFTRP